MMLGRGSSFHKAGRDATAKLYPVADPRPARTRPGRIIKSPSMLSVIIPTMNSERMLVPTLAMLVPGAVSGVVREVTIVDGGSTDATLKLADAAGCAVAASSAPLGGRLNRAAAAARGPWLMFLRAGTVLDVTWLEETARFIEEAGGAEIAAVFRRSISVRSAHPVIFEALALLKFELFRRAHPDQGLLIDARLYKEIGGHREAALDPEADLLARIGRRRILMLRSGARR
jgi:glycosyltransferase involved in cell wall biosynthesis